MSDLSCGFGPRTRHSLISLSSIPVAGRDDPPVLGGSRKPIKETVGRCGNSADGRFPGALA